MSSFAYLYVAYVSGPKTLGSRERGYSIMQMGQPSSEKSIYYQNGMSMLPFLFWIKACCMVLLGYHENASKELNA
jgi:hypothetical protein